MRNIKYFVILGFSVLLMLFVGEKVKANYRDMCDVGDIEAGNGSYYSRCYDENIYLMPGNKNSSYIITDTTFNDKQEILYAGVVNGLDTFYSTRFRVYSVVYDDRGLFSKNEDMWIDLSIDGVLVYTGEFENNILIDNSSQEFFVYNQVGTYLIRQYRKGQIVSAIRMVVVNRFDNDLLVDSVTWGDEDLSSERITRNDGDIVFNVGGGKYGYGPNVLLNVNSCELEMRFSKKIVLSYDSISQCLVDNDTNKITLKLTNGLKMEKTFTYKFDLLVDRATIKLINSISTLTTNSRRIVIKASPGENATLDTNYNLYYWSTSPSDNLTYSDFMSNYEKSEYKGTYNSNMGVILRNEEGTYYLYALAKDENSVAVVRSDEYILTKEREINRVSKDNVIFVILMVIVAACPVFIYLLIRDKDTI